MTRDTRRTTLVLTGSNTPARPWNDRAGGTRLIFVRNMTVLRFAISAMQDLEADVQRIIIDHAATMGELLQVLAEIPDTFRGDVLLLRRDGMFLSAATRGDGRKLWMLQSGDLDFYLREHHLVTSLDAGGAAMRPTVHAVSQ